MGDRGNVAIMGDDGNAVVLYTHWGGYDLPETVAKALGKRWRWTDGAYLARIVFDEMTSNEHGTETGYGITANALSDNEYDVLVLDPQSQRIAARSEGSWLRPVLAQDGITFDEFLAMDDKAHARWAGRDHE